MPCKACPGHLARWRERSRHPHQQQEEKFRQAPEPRPAPGGTIRKIAQQPCTPSAGAVQCSPTPNPPEPNDAESGCAPNPCPRRNRPRARTRDATKRDATLYNPPAPDDAGQPASKAGPPATSNSGPSRLPRPGASAPCPDLRRGGTPRRARDSRIRAATLYTLRQHRPRLPRRAPMSQPRHAPASPERGQPCPPDLGGKMRRPEPDAVQRLPPGACPGGETGRHRRCCRGKARRSMPRQSVRRRPQQDRHPGHPGFARKARRPGRSALHRKTGAAALRRTASQRTALHPVARRWMLTPSSVGTRPRTGTSRSNPLHRQIALPAASPRGPAWLPRHAMPWAASATAGVAPTVRRPSHACSPPPCPGMGSVPACRAP